MPKYNTEGWIDDPETVDNVCGELEQPFFGDAADNLKGYGEGKTVLLYKSFEKINIANYVRNQGSVGSCTAASSAGLIDLTKAIEIADGERSEFQALTSIEHIYRIARLNSRISGDGAVVALAIKAMNELGTLAMLKYGNIDLTKYDVDRCRKWGNNSGYPKELDIEAKKHTIGQFSQIRSYEEARDSIAAGYGIVCGSNYGYSSVCDKDGFAKQDTKWSHAMYWAACRADKEGILVVNSWGCYSDDTEVLTNHGWKLFKDLEVLDKIATLNSDNKLEFQFPTEYQKYDNVDKLYNFKGRNIDLLVTNNHNMYCANTRKKEKFGFKQAESIALDRTQNNKFKKNCAGIENGYILSHKVGKFTFKMDVWLEFLGYFLSEGSCGIYETYRKKREYIGTIDGVQKYKTLEEKNVKQLQYSVSISQLKEDTREKIFKCLSKMGIKFSFCDKAFYLNGKDLVNELIEYGKCSNKFIPDYVWDCNIDQLKIFYEALMLGDGTRSGGKNTYYTSSLKLANDFQRLLLSIGYSGDIRTIDRRGEVTSQGKRRVLIEYHVRIKEKYNETCPYGGWLPKLIDYNKSVYCVTVPNSVIYVRRNGNGVWCGNSWNKMPIRKYGEPEGSFWIRPEDCEKMTKGDCWSIGQHNGYPKRIDSSLSW